MKAEREWWSPSRRPGALTLAPASSVSGSGTGEAIVKSPDPPEVFSPKRLPSKTVPRLAAVLPLPPEFLALLPASESDRTEAFAAIPEEACRRVRSAVCADVAAAIGADEARVQMMAWSHLRLMADCEKEMCRLRGLYDSYCVRRPVPLPLTRPTLRGLPPPLCTRLLLADARRREALRRDAT
eukprot:Hpha_TRINITY_DN21510_c0_g1::TRINITY_DN21510_c0_g1_i1::g.14::m.14